MTGPPGSPFFYGHPSLWAFYPCEAPQGNKNFGKSFQSLCEGWQLLSGRSSSSLWSVTDCSFIVACETSQDRAAGVTAWPSWCPTVHDHHPHLMRWAGSLSGLKPAHTMCILFFPTESTFWVWLTDVKAQKLQKLPVQEVVQGSLKSSWNGNLKYVWNASFKDIMPDDS